MSCRGPKAEYHSRGFGILQRQSGSYPHLDGCYDFAWVLSSAEYGYGAHRVWLIVSA